MNEEKSTACCQFTQRSCMNHNCEYWRHHFVNPSSTADKNCVNCLCRLFR